MAKQTKLPKDIVPRKDALIFTETVQIEEMRFNGEMYVAILADGREFQMGRGDAQVEVDSSEDAPAPAPAPAPTPAPTPARP